MKSARKIEQKHYFTHKKRCDEIQEREIAGEK